MRLRLSEEKRIRRRVNRKRAKKLSKRYNNQACYLVQFYDPQAAVPVGVIPVRTQPTLESVLKDLEELGLYPLILPQPVYVPESFWEEYRNCRDKAKLIKKYGLLRDSSIYRFEVVVIDIDSPFEDAYSVWNELRERIGLRSGYQVYRTKSGRFRAYIYLLDGTKDLKRAKELVAIIYAFFEKNGLNADETLVYRLNHPVFYEKFPLYSYELIEDVEGRITFFGLYGRVKELQKELEIYTFKGKNLTEEIWNKKPPVKRKKKCRILKAPSFVKRLRDNYLDNFELWERAVISLSKKHSSYRYVHVIQPAVGWAKYLELPEEEVVEYLVRLLGEEKRKDIEKAYRYANELEFNLPERIEWLGKTREEWEQETLAYLRFKKQVSRQEIIKEVFANQRWLCDTIMEGLRKKKAVVFDSVSHGRGRPRRIYKLVEIEELPVRKAVGCETIYQVELELNRSSHNKQNFVVVTSSHFRQNNNSPLRRAIGGGWFLGDRELVGSIVELDKISVRTLISGVGEMRRKLGLATVLAFAVALSSCGGGGGGGSAGLSSTSNSSSTTKSLTYTVSTTRAPSQVSLFNTGDVALVCGDEVYTPVENTGTQVRFQGNSFNNCVLTITAGDGSVVSTTNELVSLTGNSGSVTVDTSLNVVSGTGVATSPVEDKDGDHVADFCEHSKINHYTHTVEQAPIYDKTVILVMEADDLGDSTLTDYLKQNLADLINSVSQSNLQNIRFLVIYDGDKEDNSKGSDIFIIDPSKGETVQKLDDDMSSVLNGAPVSNYAQDGLLYWYAKSDDLSHHIKEILEIASRIAPAKSYDLIISGHGDDWVSLPAPQERSVILENDSGNWTWIGTKQFATDVLAPLTKEGMNFDLLGFDECLMGDYQNFVLFSPYAKVILASPSNEPGEGWGSAYAQMGELYAQSPDGWSVAKNIVDIYYNDWKNSLAAPLVGGLIAVESDFVKTLKDKVEVFYKEEREFVQNNLTQLQQNTVVDTLPAENRKYIQVSDYYLIDDLKFSPLNYCSLSDSEKQQIESDQQLVELLDPIFRFHTGAQEYNAWTAGEGPVPYFSNVGWFSFNLNVYPIKRDLEITAREVGATALEKGDNALYTASKDLADYLRGQFGTGYYLKYAYFDPNDNQKYSYDFGTGFPIIDPYMEVGMRQSQYYEINLCNYEDYYNAYKDVVPEFAEFVKFLMDYLKQTAQDNGVTYTCSADGSME